MSDQDTANLSIWHFFSIWGYAIHFCQVFITTDDHLGSALDQLENKYQSCSSLAYWKDKAFAGNMAFSNKAHIGWMKDFLGGLFQGLTKE